MSLKTLLALYLSGFAVFGADAQCSNAQCNCCCFTSITASLVDLGGNLFACTHPMYGLLPCCSDPNVEPPLPPPLYTYTPTLAPTSTPTLSPSPATTTTTPPGSGEEFRDFDSADSGSRKKSKKDKKDKKDKKKGKGKGKKSGKQGWEAFGVAKSVTLGVASGAAMMFVGVGLVVHAIKNKKLSPEKLRKVAMIDGGEGGDLDKPPVVNNPMYAYTYAFTAPPPEEKENENDDTATIAKLGRTRAGSKLPPVGRALRRASGAKLPTSPGPSSLIGVKTYGSMRKESGTTPKRLPAIPAMRSELLSTNPTQASLESSVLNAYN